MRIPENLTPEAKAYLRAIDLAQLIANIPGHVYLKDRNGVYIYANDRPSSIDGLTDGDAPGNNSIGKTDFDFLRKDQAETLRNEDREIMKSDKTKIFKEIGRLSNGTLATFVSVKAPLRDRDGQVIGIIGSSINISDLNSTSFRGFDGFPAGTILFEEV